MISTRGPVPAAEIPLRTLLAAALALTFLLTPSAAAASYDTLLVFRATDLTGCAVNAVGRNTGTFEPDVPWEFVVTVHGTSCPLAMAGADACVGDGSVAGGFSAACSSGATFSAGGVGIDPAPPSLVTLVTCWTYGDALRTWSACGLLTVAAWRES